MAKVNSACKIKIKDPALAKLLGGAEFETFTELDNALRPGDELLVSDPRGHFVAVFEKFSTSGDKLRVIYRDNTGKGQAPVDEILGKANETILKEFESGLDEIARARLIPIQPPSAPPTTPTAQGEELEYNPENSNIKIERFESTTGQDVKSEWDGTLDDRDSTLSKVALKDAIAKAPHRYRFFIVKDTDAYFNDEGIAPTGEVLLVVHAAAYESLEAELGRTPSQEELNGVAVKMQGNRIAAEGEIYTLPLEKGESGTTKTERVKKFKTVKKVEKSVPPNILQSRVKEIQRELDTLFNTVTDGYEGRIISDRIEKLTGSRGLTLELISRTTDLGNKIALEVIEANLDGYEVITEEQVFDRWEEVELEDRGSFFSRNHNERIEIYADKYDVTPAQADAHFRAGYERMQAARGRARTAPVEVKAISVSQGSYTNETITVEDFIADNNLSDVSFFVALSSDKVKGRVYLKGKTPDGTEVEMLTVPNSVLEQYGADFLWETYLSGGVDFLTSLLGGNRRRTGPYMRNGVMFHQGNEVTTNDEFLAALSENSSPMLSDKAKKPDGVSTMFLNGEFVTVPNSEFIIAHTGADGNLWKHRGRVVPYSANRYIYLDIPEGRMAQRTSTPSEQLDRAVAELFRDPLEYDRISLSREPRDVAIKVMLPHLFTKAFKLSQSYPRFRKRMRVNGPTSGSLAIPFPVGGRYFGNKPTAQRKIVEIINNYTSAGIKLPFEPTLIEFNNYITQQVEQAIADGIELTSHESLPNALYTHFANKFVSDTETQILGLGSEGTGVYGENTPSYWNQPETSSVQEVFTETPLRPTPVARVLRTETTPEFVAESDEKFSYVPLNELSGFVEFDREVETKFNEDELNDLVEDIRINGIKNPITLQIYGGKALITEGNHRIAAAKRLGIKNIPVYVENRSKDFGSGLKSKAKNIPAGGFSQIVKPSKPSTNRAITLDAYRALSKSQGTWTDEMETKFQKELATVNGDVIVNGEITVGGATSFGTTELAYNGPTNVKLDSEGSVSSFTQVSVEPQTYEIVSSGSELGRQMLSEGLQVASPDFENSVSLPNFYVPTTQQEDAFLVALESLSVKAHPPTPEYNYAVELLGKNFAQKLFSTGQPVTFADIERHRADLGKDFSFTKFNSKKEMPISSSSLSAISSGDKTITLRNPESGYSNKSGLVEIAGEVFDIQEVGELSFRDALDATNMTQQEFAKAFLGSDAGIDSVFDEGVRGFLNGEGTRRVYTIRKLGEPINWARRKSRKKPLPC